MSRLILKNFSSVVTSNEIFLSFGDENILRIHGSDINLLVNIVEILKTTEFESTAYDEVNKKCPHSREHFDLIIDYLIQNGAIERKVSTEDIASENVLLIGSIKKDPVNTYFSAHPNKIIKYNFFDLDDFPFKNSNGSSSKVGLIFVFSPVLLELKHIHNVIERFPEAIILHCGIENHKLILGPILDSKLMTPSFKCYLKRKLASTDKPEKLIEVGNYQNINKLQNKDISAHYLFRILIEIIKIEVDKFLTTGRSRLLSREVEFDLLDYSLNAVKILRTNSDWETTISAPFNG